MARPIFYALVIALGTLAASPAGAQFQLPNLFDTLFGPPPRPPADVPGGSRTRPPDYDRRDLPPYQTLPPGPPPSAGPRGPVQTQPLPPPPGVATAPPGAAPIAPRQPGATPAALPPPPQDDGIIPPSPNKIVHPRAVFAGLDKITGRITAFDVAIGETVRFGALEVTPRACYTRPPTETASTDGFVEVDELTLQGELRRIFSGWMYAASPGLNAVEHPIYDVWLTDCKGGEQAPVAEVQPEPPPAARTSPRRPAPQRRSTAPAQPLPPPPQR